MDLGLFIIDNEIQTKFENGDFAGDTTLETSVLISLFTDKRISAAELPAGETKRRGWWGDMFPDVEGDKIGSKLWLLDRGKKTEDILPLVEAHANAALQWLIDDGVAKSVETVADFVDNFLSIEVTITRPDEKNSIFGFVWNEQELRRS